MKLVKALTHRPFAWLWSGQFISQFGDSLYRIALAWWVLEKTGSAAAMGKIFIFTYTPMLIFLIIGGVMSDRLPRFKVMLGSDLIRGFLVATITILSYAQLLEVWHLYVISLCFGFVDAFFRPTYMAMIPEVTPAELLPSANSLNNLALQFSNVLGPSLGALLISLGGTSLTFSIDAASFFVSALCLLQIPKKDKDAPQKKSEKHFVEDLKLGFKTVFASPWLWVTILVCSFLNMFSAGPKNVSLPFLIRDVYAGSVNALGWMTSCMAIGSVLGALILGHHVPTKKRGYLFYMFMIINGVMFYIIGMRVPYVVSLLAMCVVGFMVTAITLIWDRSVQEIVPGPLLGRVFSIDLLGSYVFMPIGFGLAGWATDLLGSLFYFKACGALIIIFALLALLHPKVRSFE